MEQSVLPKELPVVRSFVGHIFRKWKLNALIKKTDAYLASLRYADGEPLAQAMSDEEIRAAIFEHINTGRRADTPLFLWERQKDKAQLQQIRAVLGDIQQRWGSNERLDDPNPTQSPYERKARAVNWWDTEVQIQDDNKVLKVLKMADTAAGVDTTQGQPYFCASEQCRFNIVKDKTVLHVFGIPSKVVATFNQYVVFTHADGYDAETGTQYLLFVDLGTYNGLIGNEDIPVFRLPLKIDEPIRSLTIRDRHLIVNDRFIVQKGYLRQASEMQQVAFNLQANLLSSDSWAKVLPLVDSVQEYFQKTIRNELESVKLEDNGLKEASVLMEKLGDELQSHLDAQKRIKPLTAQEQKDLKEIVETSPADAAIDSLKLYHQRVSQSAVLADIMKQSQDRMRLSRKLAARVRLLGAALVSPRPFASQKIKEALGAWYVRHGEGEKTSMMERVLRLTDRPFVNAGVIAAGLMAAVAPESFHTMISAGLGVSTSILDYVVFCLKGLGEASAAGTSATFAPILDASGALMKQFVNDGAWFRTLVGIPTFIGVLAGLYFVPHVIFNLAQLFRDLKKPGINGFVDRQNKFREAYFARLAADEAEHRHLGENIEFSPEEEKEILSFVDKRKTEIKQRRFFGLLGHKNKDVKSTIEAAAESQNEDLAAAIDASETSAAVQKTLTDSPEDNRSFWAALKSYAFSLPLKMAGTAVKAVKKGARKLPGVASVADATGAYGKGVREFMFSMPSLELTLERWASIWNNWAMWRFATFGFGYVRILGSDVPLYIKFKPLSFAAKLLYPEFMSTVVFRRTGERVIPTEMNGGLRNRAGKLWNRFAQSTAAGLDDQAIGVDPVLVNEYMNSAANWDPRKHLQALEKFEDQIIEVEQQINEVAFRKSLEALTEYMTDKKDLKTLFNSRSLDSITQADIKELSWKSQTFLRAHFESVYNAAMSKFLGDEIDGRVEAKVTREELPVGGDSVAGAEAASIPPAALDEVDPTQAVAQATLHEMKNRLATMQIPANGEIPDYNFDLSAAKSAALAVADQPDHFITAKEAVARGRLSVGNFLRNTKYNLVADYDPVQNKSMARVEKVHRRLQSPGALGRALRAEIAKLFLTVPIDLSFRLLLTAGIFEGSMKPIQDHLFGPNSIFYLSSTSFYMMMASGFFMSMMADAWLKLQQDARQDEMGEFGQIPRGEDAERSFLRWYYKQFSAPENSLMKNWGFSNSLAFWNLPAALANITLFYFMFSGRIDLSLLTAGYILSFGTPISAVHYKIDQAFERAVHYTARGLKDEKWMAHPEVQKLLVPEMQKTRFRFTLFNDIWSNVQGNWLGNIEMIPTSLGPRGMQRAFFGGGLLEEYIVNHALQPMQNAVNGVPVLGHVLKPILKGCEYLLTHGNVDLNLKK
jgi:hypothetical protein